MVKFMKYTSVVLNKSSLLLFLAISTILVSGSLSVDAFADKDDDKKKKTFEEMCAKKKGNSPDALFCQAILGVQQSIDSFFDIFVELGDVADIQCPIGQVATGTNIDGTLLCTDITPYQHCPQGQVVVGIDANGEIICEGIPSPPPVDGTACDDNDSNTINDVYLGGVCQGTPLEIECTEGTPTTEQFPGDCKEQVICPDGNIGSIPDNSDFPLSECITPHQGICQFGAWSCTNRALICSPTVLPGDQPEICFDIKDNDCNGTIDDRCPFG